MHWVLKAASKYLWKQKLRQKESFSRLETSYRLGWSHKNAWWLSNENIQPLPTRLKILRSS